MRSSARRAALVAAAVAGFAALTPPSASATAFCQFDFVVAISPGLMTGATMVTFDSGGETGTITCNGDVYGKHITGPGTAGTSGASTEPASCASGKGAGAASFTVPTADGPVNVKYDFTFSYVFGMGPFSSGVFSGGFGFLPTKGNCFSEPVTEAHVLGFGQLTA